MSTRREIGNRQSSKLPPADLSQLPTIGGDGNCPEYVALGIHHIDRMGPLTRIAFGTTKRIAGEMMATPVVEVVLPTEALGDVLALIAASDCAPAMRVPVGSC